MTKAKKKRPKFKKNDIVVLIHGELEHRMLVGHPMLVRFSWGMSGEFLYSCAYDQHLSSHTFKSRMTGKIELAICEDDIKQDFEECELILVSHL